MLLTRQGAGEVGSQSVHVCTQSRCAWIKESLKRIDEYEDGDGASENIVNHFR